MMSKPANPMMRIHQQREEINRLARHLTSIGHYLDIVKKALNEENFTNKEHQSQKLQRDLARQAACTARMMIHEALQQRSK